MVQWLRDGLGFIKRAADIEPLARTVTDSGGVVVVPALTGLGAPHWRPNARGLISGITRGTTKAHIARAALEGIALSVADVIAATEKDLGHKLVSLKVDGGASANYLLMQLQADISQREIIRPQFIETTALGAAFLAGLGVGLWENQNEITQKWKAHNSFQPQMDEKTRDELVKRWHAALEKA